MKNLLIALLLVYPYFSAAQEHRSEIIKAVYHFELKGDNLSRTDTVLIQINERMGDNDANGTYFYSKGDKVSIDKAWIEDLNGNIIRKLKNNEIEDHNYLRDAAFHSDTYVKHFQLKHNSYPYRVFYITKTTYSKHIGIWDTDFMSRRQPRHEQKIIVDTNIDQPLKYKQANIEYPQIDTLNKTVRYTWKFAYNPMKDEINASINSPGMPKLTIHPNKFKYGVVGNWDSWQSYGNWIFRLNSKKEDLPQSEKDKIDGMIKGITDDKEKARILYHYLQDNHRYINISLKTGGLESYPASYVCTNRYGDCKALTNFMKSMLNYANIKSFYTLIDSDERVTDIDTEFPSNAFNHVILTIPFGTDTTYLECTSKELPFGYIHSSIQGRKALMIDENDSRFTNIPSTKPEETLCVRSIKIDGNTVGQAQISLKTEQKGPHFELSKTLSSSVNKSDADRYMRNNILSGSYELLDLTFDKKGRDADHIAIDASIKMDNTIKKYGNNILISPYPIDIALYEKPEDRKQDLQLDMPEYYEDTITHHLSGIDTIVKTPNDIHIDTAYGKYNLKFEFQKNTLIIKKSLLILAGRYDIDEYKGFYDFINTVRNYENQKTNIEIPTP